MARTLHKLNDVAIRRTGLKAGRHSDGGGLYLNVKPSGSKSWIFMFNRGGKRKAMGLGSYPAISLAVAREKGVALRSLVANGVDPSKQDFAKSVPTFAECVEQFLEAMEQQWKNDKHRASGA